MPKTLYQIIESSIEHHMNSKADKKELIKTVLKEWMLLYKNITDMKLVNWIGEITDIVNSIK